MEGTRKYFFAAGLSGLLLGLAYPGWNFDVGWLAWVGLIPLLFALRQRPSSQLPRSDLGNHNPRSNLGFGFKIGFVAGLVYFLIIFRWLWSVYPLNTIGIEGRLVSLLGIAAIYLVSSTGMAVFWGLFGLAFSVQRLAFSKKLENYKLPASPAGRQTTNYKLFLIIPALFVLMEYLRSWGFGFLWAGSGSLFGPHWTLGNLAYALANNSVIRWLASYVGIYGIIFLIVLVNIWFAKTFTKPRSRRNVFVGLLVWALLLLAHYWSPTSIILSKSDSNNSKSLNYAIIQTSQQTKLSPNPQETLAGFKEQLELLDRVAREHPESQLILFPEASDFFKNLSLFLTPAQVQEYFSKLFKEPRLIIAGSRILDATTGKAYSRVFSLDTQDDIIGFYDKRLVAPGGEFLPYPLKILVRIFSKDAGALFDQVRNLSPGQKETSTIGFRYQFNVAAIICSEAIAPELIKKIVQNSDVVASMASYSAFHGNQTIADQMLAVTRFRAVENRKPVITAANMGRSSVIDSRGNIINISGTHPVRGSASNGAGILTGGVDITQQKSWYNKVGDLPILLASLLLMVGSILLTWFRRSRRS